MIDVIRPSEPYEDAPDTPPMKSVRSSDEIRESYAAYLCDESRITDGKADEVVFPHSEKQVVSVMRRAYGERKPVTVSGARTGIVGGAVPSGGILLSLEFLNRFMGIRWDEKKDRWCVRVQPGLSLEALKEILDHRRFEDALSCLRGEQKVAIERFAEESDRWFYPIDPTEKSAHLGGTVATNASGARSFKYGQTRRWVVALRVVLADGTLMSLRRGMFVDDSGFRIKKSGSIIDVPTPAYQMPQVKNAAGYFIQNPMDFIDFFIGSEGTLGVITEVELALERKPQFVMSGVAFFPSEADAIRFVLLARAKRAENGSLVDPIALEYFDATSLQLLREKRDHGGASVTIPPFSDEAKAAVYFEHGGEEKDLEVFYAEYEALLNRCNGSADETWGSMNDKEIHRMTVFRHTVPEVINTIIGQRQKECPKLHKVGTDFVVPDAHLEEMIRFQRRLLDEGGFEYAVFGHIGENHLHVNILPNDEEELKRAKMLYLEFAQKAVSFGGTVSGEHGIGKIKKQLLEITYSPTALEEMRKVKFAFDPQGLLCPGNLF